MVDHEFFSIYKTFEYFVHSQSCNLNRYHRHVSHKSYTINVEHIFCGFIFILGKFIIITKKAMTTTSQPSTATVTATLPPSRNENVKTETDEKSANLSSKRDASWPSVLFYIHLNILGLYGIMVLFTNAYLTTVIFTALLSFIGIIGVTCGAHRLWAHQTYEANTFLRLFLMLCQTMAGQVNIQLNNIKFYILNNKNIV